MAMLDITVVNVALDRLIIEFDTTLDQMQWVATGYTLALATVIPLSGWAADRFGTKRIYLTAVFLFMAGSALAGTAWSAESLILFRVLQGLGGGMLMPLGMTILTKAAGPDRVGRVMAVLGVPMLLGPIVGPILGGWLVDDVSWRWIFYINVPVGIVTLILGARILDKDEPRPTEKLDVLGLLLLSPGLAALIYGLAQVPSHEGFGHPEVYLPARGRGAPGDRVLWHAARTPHALIDLKLFRDRGFSDRLVDDGAVRDRVLRRHAAVPAVLPAGAVRGRAERGPAAGAAGHRRDDHDADRRPARGPRLRGADGAARHRRDRRLDGAVHPAHRHTSYWTIGVALFVMGLGMGMTMMPIMSIALKSLQQEQVARASTSLNIIQQVAASIGTAMLSVILFNEIKDRLAPVVAQLQAQAPPGTPAPSATSIRDLPEPVRELLAPPMADGYASTFVWALVLLAIAFVPALFLPRGKSSMEPVAESGTVDGTADGKVDPATNEPPPVVDEQPEPAAER